MSEARLSGAFAFLVFGAFQSSGIVVLGSDLYDGYYGETPPFAVDQEPWLGLVEEREGFVLIPAELEWTSLEVAPGAEGPRFRLSADLGRPLLLVSEVRGLRAGRIAGASPAMADLSVRTARAEVELGGVSYDFSLESSYPEACTAVVTVSSGNASQRIPVEGVFGCGDPHFAIHWAGDLDSDGALDFLATFSMKYSYHPRQLFLSSAAAPGELVGLAALTDRTAS